MTTLRSSRRRFIGTLGAAAVAAPSMLNAGLAQAASVPFLHGIASGDPQARRVIIWTRITAPGDANPRVFWEVAADAGFTRVLRSGLYRTNATRDFTVKVDVDGLDPDSVYHYRFTCAGQRSPVGRTRTLPTGNVEQVRLAVFSCSNFPAGYFHAYAAAARMPDLHAALHLGDYIYEYGPGGYATDDAAALGRNLLPARECLTLSDYRTRHALYRGDPGLQALTASLPLIAVWDDHEVCNNTYVSGAGNHTPGLEGAFADRRAAALKAYHEWLPVRTPDTSDLRRIYRSFDFGDLLSLHMLETRLLARTEQLSFGDFVGPEGIDAVALRAAIGAETRQMMGSEQMDWLDLQMANSTALWQVLGQQVLMARAEIPAAIALDQISISNYLALTEKAAARPDALTRAERYILGQPSVPRSTDAWGGYEAAREAIYALARRHDKNLVVLAGDTHNAWASDLTDAAGQRIGVEFATPGVSSPGMEVTRRTDAPEVVAQWMVDNIPDLKYAETGHRGFMVVTATRSECRATWHFVSSVKSLQYSVSEGATLRTLPGSAQRALLPTA
jgi:alkaline phosphatase D